MNRFSIIIFVLLYLFLTVDTSCQPSERPNILFISIDDLNDWAGFMPYGSSKANTPHLDNLASHSFWFNNAHVNSPACHPSRTSILTGISSVSSKIQSNNDFPREDFLPNAVTMNDFLSDNDYKIYGTGKIYHIENTTEYWDKYIDYFDRPKPDKAPWRPEKPLFDWGPVDLPEKYWPEYQQVDFAINVLDTASFPSFLAVGFRLPHLPWYVPQSYYDDYINREDLLPVLLENDSSDLGPLARKFGDHFTYRQILEDGLYKDAVSCYKSAISLVDAQVGRLFEYAKETNTLIILWSDHGWQLGEKDKWRKFTLWERSTRVPFLFYWKNHIMPGHSNSATGLIDIFPTICDLLNINIPNFLQGNSLVDELYNGQNSNTNVVVSAYNGAYSIKTDSTRFIQYSKTEREFYITKTDTLEWQNLIDKPEYQETIDKHQIAIDSIISHAEIPTINSIPNWNIDHDQQISITLDLKESNMSWVELEFSNQKDFSNTIIQKRIYENQAYITIPTSLCSGQYYLRIREVNPISSSNWSEYESIILVNDLAYCNQKLHAFPNPARNKLTLYYLNSDPLSNHQLQITDNVGRIIKVMDYGQLNCQTCYIKIDYLKLKSGLYYLTLSNEKHSSTFKLIVHSD